MFCDLDDELSHWHSYIYICIQEKIATFVLLLFVPRTMYIFIRTSKVREFMYKKLDDLLHIMNDVKTEIGI